MMYSPDITALRELQASLNASIDEYISLALSPNTSTYITATSQQYMLRQAEKLASISSNPITTNIQRGFAPILNSALRTGIDLNLFELITSRPITLSELAAETRADPVLIFRLLRVLSTHSYFTEISHGCYQSTPLSESIRSPPIRDWIKVTFDTILPISYQLPAYLSSINYRNPGSDDQSPSPAKFTFGEEFFDHLHKHPIMLNAFNSSMKIQDMAPPPSIPVFPFPERMGNLPDKAVLLVDVGGGHGGYLESWRKAYPDLQGRVILQDLPQVAREIDPSKVSFEIMPHDFFTLQPVHGARFYHFRRILHDWSDKECKRILTNVAKGFKQGYSTLLLTELVLPDMECDKWEALRDLNMMALAGMERSRAQWEDLLGDSGFIIKEIHRAESGSLAVIEAVLMSDGAKV
jgi:hypothetical protein